MELTYEQPSTNFPQGVWTATASDRRYDAIGPDPLAAAVALCDRLSRELARSR